MPVLCRLYMWQAVLLSATKCSCTPKHVLDIAVAAFKFEFGARGGDGFTCGSEGFSLNLPQAHPKRTIDNGGK